MDVRDKSSVYGDGSCETCPGKDESPHSLCKHQTHIEIQLLCNLLYHIYYIICTKKSIVMLQKFHH